MARVPVIISHIHSTHEWKSGNRILMERLVNRFRHGIITVSRHVKDQFIQRTDLSCADKIKVLFNIAPLRSGRGDGRRIREEFALPEGCPIVGTVARLVHVKGVDIFIQAAARIAESHPDVRFVIVGNGKERCALEHLASDLGLKGKVIFAGERQDIENFYALFDIFVLSSRNEGFGNVLLEAMHHDIPVVAAAVGGVPEIVLDGQTGLLVPSEAPQKLAEAVFTLLEHPEEVQRLTAQARAHLIEFSKEKYVKTLETYYEDLWIRAGRS